MHIKKILITGRMYQHLENKVLAREIAKNFRFKAEDEVNIEDLEWADGLVCFTPFENFQFGNLKWVHTLNAGVDKFMDLKEWKDDVVLTRTVCSFGERMAEYSLSYVLQDLQRHSTFMENQNKKRWNPVTPKQIKELHIVIFGTGETGQKIAETFNFFGAKVTGVSHSGKQKPSFTSVVTNASVDDTLASADWVINTLPLTNETRNMYNEDFFCKIKDSGFINTGRGASINETALIQALDEKKIRLAVLDVFEEEPLPQNSILWEREDVIITPHISAVTTPDEAFECFVQTLECIDNGQPLPNKVDFKKGY